MPAGSQLSFQVVSTVAGGNTDVTFYSKETTNASLKPYIIYSFDSSINGKNMSMSLPKMLSVSPALDTIKNSIKVKIFPNPASSFVIIQSGEIIKYIRMCNAVGICINTISNINSNTYKINISHLAKGNYFLAIQGKNTKTTKEILKVD